MKKTFLTLLITLCCYSFLHAQDSATHQYTGKYKIPNAEMLVAIEFNQGNLMATLPAGTYPLKNAGVDTYDIVGMRNGGYVVFMRNNKKEVSGISLAYNNLLLVGSKEE